MICTRCKLSSRLIGEADWENDMCGACAGIEREASFHDVEAENASHRAAHAASEVVRSDHHDADAHDRDWDRRQDEMWEQAEEGCFIPGTLVRRR